MNTFSFVFALAAIASASAGLLAPAGPFVSAYTYASPLVAPLATRVVVAKAAPLEGQYVPDNLEKLYDDGSYKPEISPLPLSPSPYGLVPSGSGLEGQYVPDNLEKLSDDGSYKPEARVIPLSPSPYGLVPSGSGLEGQYVPDITEKFFDDGSYKPELKVLKFVSY